MCGDWDTADLMAQLSLVFQDVYLFDDTLEANVRVGNPDATRADIEEAARLSGVDEIVERLPHGWTPPSARPAEPVRRRTPARLHRPRAPESRARRPLRRGHERPRPRERIAHHRRMAALRRDATLIVIAHKLDTITAADQIVVLDEGGRVAQIGTHAELYSQADGQYRASGTRARGQRGGSSV